MLRKLWYGLNETVAEGPRAFNATLMVAERKLEREGEGEGEGEGEEEGGGEGGGGRAMERGIGLAVGDSQVVQVSFRGGATPFYQAGTRNCTACCTSQAAGAIDFDASADGIRWVNATSIKYGSDSVLQTLILTFPAGAGAGSAGADARRADEASPLKYLRYSAAAGAFPQCALYNKEGFPALPFYISLN
jgi:hypothetical protein